MNQGTHAAPQPQPVRSRPTLTVRFAESSADRTACMKLRYDTLARGTATRLIADCPVLEWDYFDKYCHHLMLRETTTGSVVAYARLLIDTRAYQAGLFFAQTQFDMGRVLGHRTRFVEVSRICVQPDYDDADTHALLWSAVTQFMTQNRVDHALTCIDLPLDGGAARTLGIVEHLHAHHLSGDDFRAVPKRKLPEVEAKLPEPDKLPALVDVLVNAGGKLCGPAYWDKRCNTADVLVIVARAQLAQQFSTLRRECA
jgi:putative hemolysin